MVKITVQSNCRYSSLKLKYDWISETYETFVFLTDMRLWLHVDIRRGRRLHTCTGTQEAGKPAVTYFKLNPPSITHFKMQK